MTGALDTVVRQALAATYDRVSVHPSLYATARGVPQRTDLRLTPWTHESDDEWSAIMIGSAETEEDGAEADERLILIAAPTATRWRAIVVAPGGLAQPLAEAVEDTIGRAMSRAENLAWTLVHRDPTLAKKG